MAQVFRKSALDKISSPDQLDKALKITSPLSWLALIGLTLIVVVVIIWSIVGTIPEMISVEGVLTAPKGTNAIFATEDGEVTFVAVYEDDELSLNYDSNGNKHGTEVILYRTPNNEEKSLETDQFGTVYSVNVAEGDRIEKGKEVVRLSPHINSDYYVAVCYVSSMQRTPLEVGKKVQIYLSGVDSQSKGHIIGRIISIDSSPSTDEGMRAVCGNLAGEMQQNGMALYAVTCELAVNPNASDPYNRNPYVWSNEKGSGVEIAGPLERVTVKIVTKEYQPIEKLFSKIKEVFGSEGTSGQ